jgi:hypothetical protein
LQGCQDYLDFLWGVGQEKAVISKHEPMDIFLHTWEAYSKEFTSSHHFNLLEQVIEIDVREEATFHRTLSQANALADWVAQKTFNLNAETSAIVQVLDCSEHVTGNPCLAQLEE